MGSLFRQEGASLRVEILGDPAVREFIDAHASVLDSSFEKTPMSEEMRRRLHRSDFVFSGMKTFHELNEAFPSLVDENGDRKPFERFLNDVLKIDRTYNANYLRAEYNFVAASADMAARWEEFAQDGDRYNLQYRTQRDGRVREEHAALDGVTLPPSDPFWTDFYPPNGWNCRCTVVQVRKSKYPATDHDEAVLRGEEALKKDSKGMFRFNPGQQGKTVPDYNPYTISKCRNCDIAKGKGTMARKTPPASELCNACKYLHECKYTENDKKKGTGISAEEKNRILALPRGEQFSEEYAGVSGKVFEHLLVCRAKDDYPVVMDVARAFADMFGDVFLNPEVHCDSPQRKGFYDDMPEDARCNPDLKTALFGYVDVKSPNSIPKMGRNAIHASREQLSCVCFTDENLSFSKKLIEQRTKLLFNDKNYHHDYIFWFVKGKLLKYKRP